MINIVLARVDNRLIHGQIVNEWIASVNPTHLVIIDNELVNDKFMSNVYKALLPIWLESCILPENKAVEYLKNLDDKGGRIFIIARTSRVFEKLVAAGIAIKEITFADKMYFNNKIEIPEIDKKSMRNLLNFGVVLVAIHHPDDESQIIKEKIEDYDQG